MPGLVVKHGDGENRMIHQSRSYSQEHGSMEPMDALHTRLLYSSLTDGHGGFAFVGQDFFVPSMVHIP